MRGLAGSVVAAALGGWREANGGWRGMELGIVRGVEEIWVIFGPGGKLHPAYFLEHFHGHIMVRTQPCSCMFQARCILLLFLIVPPVCVFYAIGAHTASLVWVGGWVGGSLRVRVFVMCVCVCAYVCVCWQANVVPGIYPLTPCPSDAPIQFLNTKLGVLAYQYACLRCPHTPDL